MLSVIVMSPVGKIPIKQYQKNHETNVKFPIVETGELPRWTQSMNPVVRKEISPGFLLAYRIEANLQIAINVGFDKEWTTTTCKGIIPKGLVQNLLKRESVFYQILRASLCLHIER